MSKTGDGQSLRPGTQLDVYEIEQVLGTGGFGITYKARDRGLACAVAIKEYFPAHLAFRDPARDTLTPHSEQHGENYRWGLTRFLDEARTLARFKEPGIVHVNRLFEANGTAYLVMDYVDGISLDVHLRRHGVLSEEMATFILRPLLQGLRAVHAQNVLHRDIKPGNIYLKSDGEPVLLDFGAAREALEGASAAMTMIVTPGYAPMEQYTRDERQGPWSDLYALGATLFHCLRGRAPAAAPDRLAQHVNGRGDPLQPQLDELGARISPTLCELLRDLLALSMQDRPQNADEVLARIDTLDTPAGDTLLMDLRPTSRRANEPTPTHRTAVVPRSSPAGLPPSPDSEALLQGPVPATHVSIKQLERLALRSGSDLAERAVMPAVTRSRTAAEAIDRIADFIPDEASREEFERHARVVLKAAVRASQELSSGEADLAPQSRRSAAPAPVSRRSQPPPTSGRRSVPPSRPAPPSRSPDTAQVPSEARTIDEGFADEVEQRLAEALGPIASMLVRRALPRAGSHAELVRMLADELDDDAERARFTRGLL